MVRTVAAAALVDARMQREPWALAFGGIDLHQGAPFGFRASLDDLRWRTGPLPPSDDDPADGPWYRATRLLEASTEDGVFCAVLDTDHPAGSTATVEIRVSGEGSLAVEASAEGAVACSQSFVAHGGERFLGFGERSHAVGLERGVVENYVGEGPYQQHEYPFLADTVPPWGIRNRPDATYFPVPWMLSTRGFGVSIDRDEVSYWRLRTEAADRWSMEIEAPRLAYTVFAGPTPLDALRRFTAATGRQPAPERWWFGPWYQSGHANHVPLAEETRQADVLGGAGAATSAVETHCRYLPLGEDRGHEDSERARTALFHSRGLAALSYINPLVGQDYADAFARAESLGALTSDRSGHTVVFRAYSGGREPPHTVETQYDFTRPQATVAWGEVAERIVAAGYDGWMEDFGEYTPLDAVTSDGSTGTAPHNRYPTLYHAAAAAVAAELERRHGRRLARFARSGWTGTSAVTPIVWGGDPTTSWGFDGLASAVVEGLSAGASGVAMWGSDTGGFLSSLDRLTPELLVRWIQFSAFCPVMRTKSGGIEIPPHRRPQIWDDDVLPSWRRWSRWHTRLNDYLMAAHAEYRRSGRPIMCALELVHPDIGPLDDQYLLGTDFLVAPVLTPGAVARRVVIPPGVWLDLFDPGCRYTGPDTVEVAVGSDDIPVLVRSGAVIGLLPEDTVSLSPYAPPPGDRRDVLAFPDADATGSGALGPGRSWSTRCDGGRWSLTLTAQQSTCWDVAIHLCRRPTPDDVWGLDGWSWEHGTVRGVATGRNPTFGVRLPR